MNEKSCVGCKFLYFKTIGYSNYTMEDTEVRCSKDKNPNLPALKSDDWILHFDNWSKTIDSRCELYSVGELVILDVEGNNNPEDFTQDEEAIAAIYDHVGDKRTDYTF